MTPPSPPTPTGPMPEGPTWRLAVGAFFGGIVLIGFFVFAYLSAYDGAQVVCNALFPLTVAFSLGTALSGAFIGGEIGVQSNRNEYTFGAVGGIAALIVVFLLTTQASSRFCPAPDSPEEVLYQLLLDDVPSTAKIEEIPNDYWIKGGTGITVGFNKIPGTDGNKSSFTFDFGEKRGKCVVEILEFRHRSMIYPDEEKIEILNWGDKKGVIKNIRFNPDYLSEKQQFAQTDNSCLRFRGDNQLSGVALKNQIWSDGVKLIAILAGESANAVSTPSDDKAVCPVDIIPAGDDCVPLDSGIGSEQGFLDGVYRIQKAADLILGAVGTAFAQEADGSTVFAIIESNDVVSFGEMEQVELNRVFEQETDLFVEAFRSENVNYEMKSAILDRLVRYLNDTQEELVPGSDVRNLSQDLLGFDPADYRTIVDLSGSKDGELRFQARRVVQRFPVDGFEVAFKERLGNQFEPDTCLEEEDNTINYLRYALLYYYYNRISDKIYANGELTDDQKAELDDAHESGKRALECLPPNLKVDLALLDYGMALVNLTQVYSASNKDDEVSQSVKQAAQKFLEEVSVEENYIFPQHIVYMLLYSQSEDWANVSEVTKILRGAEYGGANGLVGIEDYQGTGRQISNLELGVQKIPISSAEPELTQIDSISAVLARTQKYEFIKFRSGDEVKFGWIEPAT